MSTSGYGEGRAFLAVLIAWILAQTVKVFLGIIRERRFNFRWLVSTGGMPSTHSAAVAALATVVGYYYGFGSIIFAITLVFTLITMFDAAGVRRAVGKQASVLNQVVDDLYETGEVKETRLRDLLGHTPIEVFVGAAMGILVAIAMR
ncbi:MAG: divergent PAP2 family protein [Candidatus Omnitrophica bacterium]|nr:divergent PAP2 family protein [Candidatus Omnitrophota bacterium]